MAKRENRKELVRIPEVTDEQWKEVNEWNRKMTEEFLQQSHLSPQTLAQYRSALRIFFRWAKEECANRPLHKLRPRDAIRYQNFLIHNNMSPSGVRFKRAAVSSLCGYIETFYADEYETFKNIFNRKISSPVKQNVKEKEPLTKDEYLRLVVQLRAKQLYQMTAYVTFTYASGCRRGEASLLLKEVVNYEKPENKKYFVTHPIRCKGRGIEGKVRRLVFDDIAMNAMKKWIKMRGEDDCPYMFVTKKVDGTTEPVSPSTFNKWCERVFSKIVGRYVHPHLFRSTRATHIVEESGKDIRSAQALLGHESSQTTELYVIRDKNQDLDDAFD